MAYRRMRNLRSYYSAPISTFLNQSTNEILGIIHTNDGSAETTIQQSNTWEAEVLILKSQLQNFTEGHIIFEYEKDDVRSSYMLEDVVSEFDIQGLELDYSIVAWDADFRFADGQWTYNTFVGNAWANVGSEERRLYLKNAYRVLLTRARQGMALFVPMGSDEDLSRRPEFYDGIYEYLREIGIPEID